MQTSLLRLLSLGAFMALVVSIVACGGGEAPVAAPQAAAAPPTATAAAPAPSAAPAAAEPTPTPGTYHFDAVFRLLKEVDGRAAALVAEFEKLKAEGKLLQMGPDGQVWLMALRAQRRLVERVVVGWQATLEEGWPATAPELKPVQACFESLSARFAPCGYWTCLNVAEQPFLTEWDKLDRIRDQAMIAAEIAKAKGDAALMQELLEEAEAELERAVKYSTDKATHDTGRGSMYANYSLNVDKHPGFLRVKAELERCKAECAAR